MSDQNGGGAYLILAFMAGAVTGAAVALLSSPQAGPETRESLRSWARGAGDKAVRVPEAVRAAYGRASVAAKEAFIEALHRETPETESSPV